MRHLSVHPTRFDELKPRGYLRWNWLNVDRSQRQGGFFIRYIDFCRLCDLHESEHLNGCCLLSPTKFTAYIPTDETL
jgi:hypothetical protein